jgi:hypothetical protein
VASRLKADFSDQDSIRFSRRNDRRLKSVAVEHEQRSTLSQRDGGLGWATLFKGAENSAAPDAVVESLPRRKQLSIVDVDMNLEPILEVVE